MKKMLSILLAVMMIATLALTGCGPPIPSPLPALSLTLWAAK